MFSAESIYKLFLFVIIWHVDTSVKELVGLEPVYPEPKINFETYELVSELIKIVVLFGLLKFCKLILFAFIFPDTSKV